MDPLEAMCSGSEIEMRLSTLGADAKWSSRMYTLDELVDESNDLDLPQIACVCTPGSNLEEKVDLNHSLLIYSRRRRTKVVAQLLFYNESSKSWAVDGPNLEIPKDYTGWFEMVEGVDNKISKFYSPCPTLEKIAKAECRKFLVRSTVVGHRYMEDENGIVFLDEVKIYVGEILRCDGIVKRKWKVVGGADDSKIPETQFLKCIDPRKKKICISLSHPGQFSPIYESEKGVENPINAVYRISDILDMDLKFPKPVRLAFGWMPKVPSIPKNQTFKGVLQLTALVRPDTLVMCSLVDNAMPLLEVPINIDIKVKLDTKKSEWVNHPATKATLKRCYNKVYPFLTSTKIMDIKYKARDMKNKEGSGSQKQKYGRMASPVDMNSFNPLDVYPPMIKESDIADTWTLSFRDPETVDASNGERSGSSRRKGDLREIHDREVRAREAHC